MRRQITTQEEKQAKKLAEILSDLRLDLDLVGFYFAQNVGSTLYNRLQIVYETAQEIKETKNDRNTY
jgi:rubrerythrin